MAGLPVDIFGESLRDGPGLFDGAGVHVWDCEQHLAASVVEYVALAHARRGDRGHAEVPARGLLQALADQEAQVFPDDFSVELRTAIHELERHVGLLREDTAAIVVEEDAFRASRPYIYDEECLVRHAVAGAPHAYNSQSRSLNRYLA